MPLLDVERGAHAGERKAELDQGDGDGGLHADYHRVGVEHPRHRRDVAEHAADERIDDLERRDVDQHAARAVGDDPVGEIVLERHRQAVVHVHLDRDQQAVAHLQDRDVAPSGVRRSCRVGARSTTASPSRRERQGESVGQRRLGDDTPRSTPRWTMVCAICGRMPLMMQSAPISRAAATVLIRCCATNVSTVGTPVMSMIAISAPVLDDLLEQVLHDDLGARAVERADQRQGEDALPQPHDRRGELEQLLLLAAMISSRLFWKASTV